MFNDFGYYNSILKNLQEINEKQLENIEKAASLMSDAIQNDRLINVYGGGGHTTLPVGEMFFRAGGLANINRFVGFQPGEEVSRIRAHRQLRLRYREIL